MSKLTMSLTGKPNAATNATSVALRSKWWILLLIAAPSALVAASMWASLSAGLVWDDKFLLTSPFYLRHGFSLISIFSPVLTNTAAYWRPFGMLFLAPQLHLVPNPFTAHAANLFLYAFLCSLFSLATHRALRRAFPSATRQELLFAALAAGCYLALHPGVNQAAYWIAHRFHVVGALSLLGSFVGADALMEAGRRKSALALLAMGAFAAGLSSESSMPWILCSAALAFASGWRVSSRATLLIGAAIVSSWYWLRLVFLGAFPYGDSPPLGLGALSDLAESTLVQIAPWLTGLPGGPLLARSDPGLAAVGLALFSCILLLGLFGLRKGMPGGKILTAWAAAMLLSACGGRLLAAENASSVLGGEYVAGAAFLFIGLAFMLFEARHVFSGAAKPVTRKIGAVAALACLAAWFAMGAARTQAMTLAWQSDMALWSASLARHPGSPLASSNAMVALSRSGKPAEALAVGEALWGVLADKKELTRQEITAAASYIALLDRNGDSSEAASKATLMVPKSAKEPLMALTAATVFLGQSNWSDAINAANFSLARYGKDWNSKKMAAALFETLARAELGAGHIEDAEGHLIKSKAISASRP